MKSRDATDFLEMSVASLLSNQVPKHIDQLPQKSFDWVVTVCDNAAKSCPSFPGALKVLHQAFEDPPKLAAGAKCQEEALEYYRQIRDEIHAFVQEFPVLLR